MKEKPEVENSKRDRACHPRLVRCFVERFIDRGPPTPQECHAHLVKPDTSWIEQYGETVRKETLDSFLSVRHACQQKLQQQLDQRPQVQFRSGVFGWLQKVLARRLKASRLALLLSLQDMPKADHSRRMRIGDRDPFFSANNEGQATAKPLPAPDGSPVPELPQTPKL